MAFPPKLCGDCGTQMEPMPDLYAMPGLDKTEKGLSFNMNRAVPVTVYMCSKCGRFKFMSAALLGNLKPEAEQTLSEGQK
jgi:hypothetical protein